MIPAWDKALELLSISEHSTHDLKRKLQKKGYEKEEIEQVLQRLSEYGYLSDERYARAYIRRALPSRSIRLICQELGQKGIRVTPESPLVSEVLEEEDYSEESQLLSVILRRVRGKDLSDEKERRRLYGYLQRRGFSYHSIQKTMIHLSL